MTNQKKTIIITGTHHTPAIELIKQLQTDRKTDWQIHYIGHIYSSETHIKNTLIPLLKDNFHQLECGKFDRRFISKTLRGIPITLSALFKAYVLLRRIKPDVVVSFGGYVSVPVILAAFLQKIPTLTHEQTLTNSLSTRINSLFATKVALSFDNKKQIFQLPSKKVIVTGNLLRSEIFNNCSDFFSQKKLSLAKYPLIYITGGNQGSRFINDLTIKILPELTKNFTVIHQTGALGYKDVIKSTSKIDPVRYLPLEYIGSQDIGWIFHHAALIISRSGANSCQEIAALCKPVIFIPHPYTQQNEQLLNALWVKEKQPKITQILDQLSTSPELLLQAIKKSLVSAPLRQDRPVNNYNILNLIHEIS